MNNEVIKMLVSVQDDLARAVVQVNAEQRRDDETIAALQRELTKLEERAFKQEVRADTLEEMLIHTRQQRDGSNMLLQASAAALTRTRNELVRVNNELASVLVNQPQQPRPPTKRKLFPDDCVLLFEYDGDRVTPQKK